MLFRFWLSIALIVAFVACTYSEVFRIGPIPAVDPDSVFPSPSARYMILNDDAERGR